MRVAPRILTVVLMLLLAGNAVAAVDMAPFTGEYWYDWIGNSDSGHQPGAESGTVTITTDSMSLTSLEWPDASDNDFGFTFVDTTLDADGNLTLFVDTGGPELAPETVFANGHYISRLTRDETDGPLSHGLMVRVAEAPTASDVEGDYAVFRYAMHTDIDVDENLFTDGTEGVLGTATISNNGTANEWTLAYNYVDSNGAGSDTGGGSWTLDTEASTMTLDGTPSVDELKIGTGGILTSTVVDDGKEEGEEGTGEDPARLILIKKGTDRTITEAIGHYALQGFGSSTDGDEFWTTWGTLDLFEDGTWTATTSSSSGEVDHVSQGSFTVADDGTMVITDNDGGNIDGVLSLDGDLIALAFAFPDILGEDDEVIKDGEINTMLAMRPLAVPEPSTLALLLLGGLGWMAFRRCK